MTAFTPVTLSTDRLTLRWLEAGDAQAQFAIYCDPECMRYWSSAPWTSLDQADDFYAKTAQAYADGNGMRFAIILTATGELIGNCSLHALFPQNRRCETGYVLSRQHWGHGYAAEAMRALLDFGFTEWQLNRVEADIDPRNTGSARLLTTLKFKKEGFLPERWIVGGEVCDTDLYGLLARDWHAS